ncbi:hypothetical protein BBP40_004086 [Aspergillus hancockii]|nr:hypothetical protein BBP40_004086 [Aspergillus hancockii]
MTQTTVLIAGANRGIGKGLLAAYLAKAKTTVIATCRDASEQNTKELRSLPRGRYSNLIIVSLSLDTPGSILDAVSQLQGQNFIAKIDIVIANAGICNHWGPLVHMTDSDLVSHLDVNTLGPLRLFRATLPLLQASSQPKFIYISSELASISGVEHSSSLTAAYGASKAAGNYLVKKIDAEYPNVIAFSVDPGFVQTDMGNRGAQCNGLKKAPMTVSESVEGIAVQVRPQGLLALPILPVCCKRKVVNVLFFRSAPKIEKASKATTSGKFIRHNGEGLPW